MFDPSPVLDAGRVSGAVTDPCSAATTSWRFADIPVAPAPNPPSSVVQPKLVVGSAGERLEREADAVADRVM
jgi:hypothetical protein